MLIADLSYYQGTIDWSKVNLDLAVIRVQYGSNSVDSKYKEYVAGCKKYNIPFAHYAYARFVNFQDAEKEATDFLSRIDKDAKFLVVDVEEITVKNINDLIPSTQRFIDVCKKAGYKVGLYSGESFYKSNGLSKVKCDFLWIAKYSNSAPSIPCDLWQNAQGKVNGINGNVDLNQLNGSKTLDWFIGSAEIMNQPTPVIKEEKEMLDKAIVINGFADFATAEPLADKLKAPIYTRAALPTGKIATELYVVGGKADGLLADNIILLSGADRYEVAASVKKFLG